MRDNRRVKTRSFIAVLLGLLLAIQPAFAAGSPRCAHHDQAAGKVAMAHHGHHGGAMHDHQQKQGQGKSKSCDCGCLGSMAGCLHAGATVAMSERLLFAIADPIAEAPSLPHDATHVSTRLEPPLRPPIRA